MKNFRVLLLSLIIISAFATTVNAQKKDKKMSRDSVQAAAVERLLASKNYTFTAEYASATQGGATLLTSYYYLEVTPDEVSSVLPYYGNSYSGGGTSDSGIKLSSKKFDYSVVKNAAGHWYVSIKPKDSATEKEVALDVASDGTAGLVVLSSGRGRMSYTGIIEAKGDNK
jgi:hypothetical protein